MRGGRLLHCSHIYNTFCAGRKLKRWVISTAGSSESQVVRIRINGCFKLTCVTYPTKKSRLSLFKWGWYDFLTRWIGHFRITVSRFLEASLGAHPFIWKWDLIHMQIKLVFIRMDVHQTSLWLRGLRQLRNVLLVDGNGFSFVELLRHTSLSTDYISSWKEN